jgi:hypothetical protein
MTTSPPASPPTTPPTGETPRRTAWPSGPDRKLLVVTGLVAVAAGLIVAGLILLATGKTTDVAEPGEPITIGLESAIHQNLEEEGPYFYPDPLGGDRNVLMALEDGEVVALSNIVPASGDCRVQTTGDVDVLEDCEGNPIETTELNRYRLVVNEEPPQEGALQIDFDRLILAPDIEEQEAG